MKFVGPVAGWFLDRVPCFMRTWPWLRQYYWTQEEIDRIKVEAERMSKLFNPPEES